MVSQNTRSGYQKLTMGNNRHVSDIGDLVHEGTDLPYCQCTVYYLLVVCLRFESHLFYCEAVVRIVVSRRSSAVYTK